MYLGFSKHLLKHRLVGSRMRVIFLHIPVPRSAKHLEDIRGLVSSLLVVIPGRLMFVAEIGSLFLRALDIVLLVVRIVLVI